MSKKLKVICGNTLELIRNEEIKHNSGGKRKANPLLKKQNKAKIMRNSVSEHYKRKLSIFNNI